MHKEFNNLSIPLPELLNKFKILKNIYKIIDYRAVDATITLIFADSNKNEIVIDIFVPNGLIVSTVMISTSKENKNMIKVLSDVLKLNGVK